MRQTAMLLLWLGAPFGGATAQVIELESFPGSDDRAIAECRAAALDARARGTATCATTGFGDYWACPQSWPLRREALATCEADAAVAIDRAQMLYLRGLVHEDFRLQSQRKGADCPPHYRFQEGSEVCVYTADHYVELIAQFPDSVYADMAAYRRAAQTYRYYECEGQRLCETENQIAGWIEFLVARPASPRAGAAVETIVKAFEALAAEPLDPRAEYPAGLLRDVASLETIAPRLGAANRDALLAVLASTKALLEQLATSPR